jgi:intein/homing endonuclease
MVEELKKKKGITAEMAESLKLAIDYYNQNNIGIQKCANMFNLTPSFLFKYIKQYSKTRVATKDAITFDTKVFDVIDTEEKAYWLGFSFADGYISDDGNYELSLGAKDYNHLLKFGEFIKNKDKVRLKDYRCRCSMRNKHFCDTLNNYGHTPRKSLTLKFPDLSIFKSKDLIRHFIRGYIDGDGCIGIYKNTAKISILGTIDFLNSINKILPNKGNIRLPKNKNQYVFESYGPKAHKNLEYLFKDSTIYLDRKYTKYQDICRLYEKS